MKKFFIINIVLTIFLYIVVIYKVKKKYGLKIKTIIFLLFVTFLSFCGLIFLFNLIKIEKSTGFDLFINSLFICLSCFGIFLPTVILIKSKEIKTFCYFAKLELDDEFCYLKMFLDSGNFLYDKKSFLPIVLVSINKLTSKYNDKRITYLSCKYNHKISIGELSFFVVKPKCFSVLINGKWQKKKVLIGLTEKDFHNYDGLFGLKVIQ